MARIYFTGLSESNAAKIKQLASEYEQVIVEAQEEAGKWKKKVKRGKWFSSGKHRCLASRITSIFIDDRAPYDKSYLAVSGDNDFRAHYTSGECGQALDSLVRCKLISSLDAYKYREELRCLSMRHHEYEVIKEAKNKRG